jgi:phage-related protein (TIGR01555 family)
MKNFLNAITLESEDDYEQKQITFTGLAEMLDQIRIGIASAIRMPMAKIFGLASKGFASGEDDIENYNAIVEGQRERAEDVLDKIIPIIALKVWGFVPDDLSYEWKPLRVLTAEQEENVKTSKFNRLSQLYSQGILTPQEYCEALKQESIFTMETEVSKGAEPEPASSEMDEETDSEGKETSKPSDGKKPTKAKE